MKKYSPMKERCKKRRDDSKERVNEKEYRAFVESLISEIRALHHKCPLLFEAMNWPENKVEEDEI